MKNFDTEAYLQKTLGPLQPEFYQTCKTEVENESELLFTRLAFNSTPNEQTFPHTCNTLDSNSFSTTLRVNLA
jgi:hypothetical protein